MSDQWYYSRDGQEDGPFPYAVLQQMAKVGNLLATDKLREATSQEWRVAADFPDLFVTVEPRSVSSDSSSLKGLTMALGIEPAKPGHDSLLGCDIGGVTIVRLIAEGGMGRVYEGKQEKPKRTVAVKFMRPGLTSPSVLRRFEYEAEVLARLQHPGIAHIYSVGVHRMGNASVPYFIMEYIADARTLTKYANDLKLPTRQRLDLFRSVCDAVAHGHQKGVIHRDLKPTNILVDASGQPKVIDFGVARATDSDMALTTMQTDVGQLIGTLQYMSPEQFRADPNDIDVRSDVYALGVILYELLAGKMPYDVKKKAVHEVARIVQEDDPKPLSSFNRALKGDVAVIAWKCLEKDRGHRYPSASELGADIGRYLAGDAIVAKPLGFLEGLTRLAKRHKALTSTAAVIGLLILAFAGVSFRLYQQAEGARAAKSQQRRLVEDERDRAMTAEQAAASERDKARKAAEIATSKEREVAKTLAVSDFTEATRLIQADEGPSAVAYLSRILRANPDDRAALVRLGSLLTYRTWMVPTPGHEHGSWERHTRFSRDGTRALTFNQLLFAQLRDAKTGSPLTERMMHGSRVNNAAFSPDERCIVTASLDRTARVWDAQTGQPLTGPLSHKGSVMDSQFSPNSRYVVTASADKTARVWDAQTGQPLTNPLIHEDAVKAAKFSPDSQYVVTASADKTAWVWDAQTGQPLTNPLIHEGEVNYAEFSPDGRWVVTASADKTARVWDAQTGRPLTGSLRHAMSVKSARFSAQGKRIVTTDENVTRVWDAQNGLLLAEPLKNWKGLVLAAEFMGEGDRILTTTAGGPVQAWDARTGPPLTKILSHGGGVFTALFSPDNKRIVTASVDGTARVWDSQTGQPLAKPFIHKAAVNYAEFSPDSQRVVTASADKTARVWDALTGQPLTNSLVHEGGVNYAEFSPDGWQVVTASNDETARVWDARTGKPLTNVMKHVNAVHSARFCPAGKRIVTAISFARSAVTGRVWDAQTGLPLTELDTSSSIKSAEFSRDGNRILTSGYFAEIWDARTGQLLCRANTEYWLNARFSPDGNRIVTTSSHRGARVWDGHTGEAVTDFFTTGGGDSSAMFSADGKCVATAADTIVQMWDAQTGQAFTDRFKHGGRVSSVRFSPDGKRILTAVMDGSAHVWDVDFVPSRCPAWLLQLAEALSGTRLNEQGILEETRLDRAETIAQIRDDLNNQSDDNDGVMWGRWLLADHAGRTVSPCSRQMVPAYTENSIKAGDHVSPNETK
jgi:WD40 repeat protein/tRNA A-37 threonylcarbamoyl transferase component Bud32